MIHSLDINNYFLKPVDAENVPYYKKVVTDPMDFETMMEKAKNGKYAEDPLILIKFQIIKMIKFYIKINIIIFFKKEKI